MGKFNDKIHSKNTVTKYDIKYQWRKTNMCHQKGNDSFWMPEYITDVTKKEMTLYEHLNIFTNVTKKRNKWLLICKYIHICYQKKKWHFMNV